MRAVVVQFPGSNADFDALHALRDVVGVDTSYVFHKTPSLPAGTDLVVLPGGFSYGDYLRCGAIARFAPIMAAVRAPRRARRARARHLQRLPDPHRGGAAAGRAAPATRTSASSAAT